MNHNSKVSEDGFLCFNFFRAEYETRSFCVRNDEMLTEVFTLNFIAAVLVMSY